MSTQHDTAQADQPLAEVDQPSHKARFGLLTRFRLGRTHAAREELALERDRLAFQRERAAHAAEQPQTSPQSSTDAPERAVPWTWYRWVFLVLMAVGTLAFGAFMALVVIGLQVGFWKAFLPADLQKIELLLLGNRELDMPQFIPVAVEGGAWIFTILAVAMVLFRRSPERYTQYMWLLSIFAAMVNAVHNSTLGQPEGEHDLFTGAFTGGLSVLGPFIVHSLVVAMREIIAGTTIGKALWAGATGTASPLRLVLDTALAILLFVFDLLVHPVISVRAVAIWRGVRHFSYTQAWNYAARPYYVTLHRVYKDRILENSKPREKNDTDERHADRADRASERDEPVPPHRPDSGLTPVGEQRHGGVITAERDDRAERAGERDALDQLARVEFGRDLEQLANATDEDLRSVFGLNGTDTGTQARHDDRADRADHRDADRANGPTGRDSDGQEDDDERQTAVATTAEMGAKELVAHHWWTLKHAGTDPGTVNRADVARLLGVDRSTVSKVFKACREGGYPDTTEERKA